MRQARAARGCSAHESVRHSFTVSPPASADEIVILLRHIAGPGFPSAMFAGPPLFSKKALQRPLQFFLDLALDVIFAAIQLLLDEVGRNTAKVDFVAYRRERTGQPDRHCEPLKRL
jgi:hypothetical protein